MDTRKDKSSVTKCAFNHRTKKQRQNYPKTKVWMVWAVGEPNQSNQLSFWFELVQNRLVCLANGMIGLVWLVRVNGIDPVVSWYQAR